MNKYNSPASPNQYGSFNLALPSPTMSIIPMIKTNVVSLKRLINVFTIGGIDIFRACGRIISR